MTKRGRRNSPPFVRLNRDMLESDAYAQLSPKAVKLMVDMLNQYNGYNNGDLSITWSIMKKRGWKSNGTVWKAAQELIDKKFILLTRQGGKNQPNLYASTFHAIDDHCCPINS